MVKKFFVSLIILSCSPFLSACNNGSIVTSTGSLGKRAEVINKYMHQNSPKKSNDSKSSVIYLGRDYENNQFGPSNIKFVFE